MSTEHVVLGLYGVAYGTIQLLLVIGMALFMVGAVVAVF